jgi:hypothetical protein
VNADRIEYALNNCLRFKGLGKEQEDQASDYALLKKIGFGIYEKLEKNEKVIARHYAVDHSHPIEFVHEAFGVLIPFYDAESLPFKRDEVDELYGFPTTIEESSRIFDTLGRRDVKLEFQHRILSKTENSIKELRLKYDSSIWMKKTIVKF